MTRLKSLNLSLAAALLALSGCMPATDTISASPTAGPGAAFMSPYDAGVIFADVCLTRGARFERAREGLVGFPFTQNTRTGTYYHNTANLSVKVSPQSCSMVYGTRQDTDAAKRGLAQGTASVIATPPAGISVTSRNLPDGVTYFRLGLTN
jgi:hypothetical protein